MTNLLLYRKKYKKTQEDMAKVIGKTSRAYSSKENGKLDFTLTEAKKIHEEFQKENPNVTMEDIFFNKQLT